MHLVINTNYQQIRDYTITDAVKLSVRIRQYVAQPSDHRVDSGQGQGSGNDSVKGDARWQMIAAVLGAGAVLYWWLVQGHGPTFSSQVHLSGFYKSTQFYVIGVIGHIHEHCECSGLQQERADSVSLTIETEIELSRNVNYIVNNLVKISHLF